jgi:hypothetical protein
MALSPLLLAVSPLTPWAAVLFGGIGMSLAAPALWPAIAAGHKVTYLGTALGVVVGVRAAACPCLASRLTAAAQIEALGVFAAIQSSWALRAAAGSFATALTLQTVLAATGVLGVAAWVLADRCCCRPEARRGESAAAA